MVGEIFERDGKFALVNDTRTRGVDLLAVGEMGIGNTSSAAALSCAIFGGDAEQWVGPGTGVDREGLHRKLAAVAEGVARQGTR